MLKRPRLFAATALAAIGLATAAHAVPAIGVAGGNTLFSFDTSTPGVSASRAVTGLQAGETLFGIDYRPANAVLYGLGTTGTLYTINAGTGAATFASTLNVALSGGSIDIAFNPTVDRLRVVSNNGQDLRVNVDTGVVTVDPTLAYAATDANAGVTPSVTAVAYTNQVGGTVATTTLYDIDAATGLLDIQNPPNNGTLNGLGLLGLAGLISLDIDGLSNAAYAASGSSFYNVNLTTGAATLVGAFGIANVTDFAVVSVPEPLSMALLGIGLAGTALLRRRKATAAA